MKKITIFKVGENAGAVVYDGNRKSDWNKLTRKEQIDLLNAIAGIYNLFSRFIKEEDTTNNDKTVTYGKV